MDKSGAAENPRTLQNSVRRRLLQGALQNHSERSETITAKPVVQFREPDSERSIETLARVVQESGLEAEYPTLVRMIELLTTELESRRREIRELHILLRQAMDSNVRRPWWAQAITPYWPIEEQPS